MASGISSVEVTVETPGENQVIEVLYDGQEIIQPPLTLGEHFAKQAAKIDFGSVMDECTSPRYNLKTLITEIKFKNETITRPVYLK